MVDADHYLVVWQSINGDGWKIFGRLFNKNVPVGPEFIINQTTASIQERPRTAAFSSPTILDNSKVCVGYSHHISSSFSLKVLLYNFISFSSTLFLGSHFNKMEKDMAHMQEFWE
jgi:hypothetical protein